MECPHADILVLQESKVGNENMTAAGNWVGFHGTSSRRGVTSVWVRKDLVGRVKWTDVSTILFNGDGVGSLLISVTLPTQG